MLNLTVTQQLYVGGGLATGALVGIVGSKLMRGHVCLWCVVIATVVGGVAGYLIMPPK